MHTRATYIVPKRQNKRPQHKKCNHYYWQYLVNTMIMKQKTDHSSSIFDVIVVGGGHAGVEAAHIAAKIGAKTALITPDISKIGYMPCNPSIGGIGKGHIVFEISALGGLMPKLCTQSYLQAKMLNTRKGPAVQGLRLQIDKAVYQKAAQSALEGLDNLTIIPKEVLRLAFNQDNHITGVTLSNGRIIETKTVIITGGTFLNGVIHIGEEQWPGGRSDEPASLELASCLRGLGLEMGRMKTGTPARLLRTSIDTSKMSIDETEPLEYLFEYDPHKALTKEVCYITHTNEQTHSIIQSSAERSPIFSKRITGTPTRYCPSIEDKITRFSSKTSHHVFVEPEGFDSTELYPNGISNSLPRDIQEAMIASIPGFEHAVITKYAYGIEYDFVQPNQLDKTLEVCKYPGLFLAGQINGTTGYEEAAGQGIIAGINAANKALGKPPYIMHRTEGYIGVMIDDLTNFGVDEPYRMFTSRAERRLILRQDNVFARLTPHAYALGTVSKTTYEAIMLEHTQIQDILKNQISPLMVKSFAQAITHGQQCEVKEALKQQTEALGISLSPRGYDYLFAEILYAPYHERELREIEKSATYRSLRIPPNFAYQDLPGLSRELQEKLQKRAPETVEAAQKIPGITPATISLLIFKLRELEKNMK